MIAAVIVLSVVALALGGFIAYDILHGRRHVPAAIAKSATPEQNLPAPPELEQPQAPEQSAEDVAAEEPPVEDVGPEPEPETDVKTEPEKAPEPVILPSEVRESVTATEVDNIMSDEVAESLIEKSFGTVDRTKQAIINIDTLSQYFDSGEVVTLDEIKKRVKGFNQKTTYIKVLARGTLDKALTVEADNFSLQAVKMIVLTGGKVINKK